MMGQSGPKHADDVVVIFIFFIVVVIIISVMELGHLLTRSGLSHIQKSLQRSAMIPSASWGVVFRYPG
jgi:hypothetical protein